MFGGDSSRPPTPTPPEVPAAPLAPPIFSSPNVQGAGSSTTARQRQNPSILTAGLGGIVGPTAKKSLLGA